MLLFYIDEYGDHVLYTAPDSAVPTLKNGVSEWFVLSAVGIRDSSRRPLAEALFTIKRKHFGDDVELQPWSASEIKGRYLFRVARSAASDHQLLRPAAYARLDSPPKVEALIEDLGLLFAKYRPILFVAAVDKKVLLQKKNPAPPLGAAYTYLQQRVALTLERVHVGEAAILVADQQTQHERFFRSGQMNQVRDGMTAPLPVQPNFNLVLDKPLWIDTDLSSWDREILQLADIVAYSAAECLTRGEAPKESCYLWDWIRPNFAVQWSTGSVESGGFAVYPKPASYPTT